MHTCEKCRRCFTNFWAPDNKRWHKQYYVFLLRCSCLSHNAPWQLRYQWEASESFSSHTQERRLRTEILLNYSYVTNMDRAPFRPLAELGISTSSIVAIQWPSSDQAISLIWGPVKLADPTWTCGCLATAYVLYDKCLSLKKQLTLK